jgi:hypothetical protein
MTKDEIRFFVAGLVGHRIAVLEERVAALEKDRSSEVLESPQRSASQTVTSEASK